jgi:hypothetical protein
MVVENPSVIGTTMDSSFILKLTFGLGIVLSLGKIAIYM